MRRFSVVHPFSFATDCRRETGSSIASHPASSSRSATSGSQLATWATIVASSERHHGPGVAAVQPLVRRQEQVGLVDDAAPIEALQRAVLRRGIGRRSAFEDRDEQGPLEFGHAPGGQRIVHEEPLPGGAGLTVHASYAFEPDEASLKVLVLAQVEECRVPLVGDAGREAFAKIQGRWNRRLGAEHGAAPRFLEPRPDVLRETGRRCHREPYHHVRAVAQRPLDAKRETGRAGPGRVQRFIELARLRVDVSPVD